LSHRPHSVNLKSTWTSPLTTQVQEVVEELPVCTEPLLGDGFHRTSTASPFTARFYLRIRGASIGCRAPGRGTKPRSMGGRSQAHAWLLLRTAAGPKVWIWPSPVWSCPTFFADSGRGCPLRDTMFLQTKCSCAWPLPGSVGARTV
jgi:hypothetical protein